MSHHDRFALPPPRPRELPPEIDGKSVIDTFFGEGSFAREGLRSYRPALQGQAYATDPRQPDRLAPPDVIAELAPFVAYAVEGAIRDHHRRHHADWRIASVLVSYQAMLAKPRQLRAWLYVQAALFNARQHGLQTGAIVRGDDRWNVLSEHHFDATQRVAEARQRIAAGRKDVRV